MENKTINSIPQWMKEKEKYIPKRDKEGFITRSLLSVLSVLSSFRTSRQYESTGTIEPSAPVKLFISLLMIILASCSHNMFFTYVLIAILLVHMCLQKEGKLLKIFLAAISASALSALILLPAIFLGSPHTMLTVSLKVFLSVGLLALMAQTTPWNKITEGLRFYRVPDLLIFTFDIALKYIVILGDICASMLSALKLRSVGKNNTKKDALSGIIGVTFLKSQQMSEDMCGAMVCRGFEGEYCKAKRSILKKSDLLFAFFALLIIGLFIYL